ncbi:MAG: VOC family protein [Pseudomonadota bacterium]
MDITASATCLTVTDAARSIDFYTGQLSFELTQDLREKGETVRAVLRHGEATLVIAAGGPAIAASDTVMLYLFVPSARAAHEELVAAGVAPGEVDLTPYGMEECRLRDPDGHVIALGSPAVQLA